MSPVTDAQFIFGKYRGRAVSDKSVPTDYMEYMLKKGVFPNWLNGAMKREIELRQSKRNNPERN